MTDQTAPVGLPKNRLSKTNPESSAAKWNTKIMHRLQEELRGDCDNLSEAIVNLPAESKNISRSSWASYSMVFQTTGDIVVKGMLDAFGKRDHQSLTYLQEHLPGFPAKIMVNEDEDGTWNVKSIITGRQVGYILYWECVKMTNNLTAVDRSDWYEYLLDSVSLNRYPL